MDLVVLRASIGELAIRYLLIAVAALPNSRPRQNLQSRLWHIATLPSIITVEL